GPAAAVGPLRLLAARPGCRRGAATGFAPRLVPTLRRVDAPSSPCPPWSPAMTSRRRFIASVSLAATGAALAPLAACSQDRPDPLPGRPREKPVGAIAGIAPLAGELIMR